MMSEFLKKIQSKTLRNVPIPNNDMFDITKETRLPKNSMVGVLHRFTLKFSAEGLVTNERSKQELQNIFIQQIEHELYGDIHSDLIELLYKAQMKFSYDKDLINDLDAIIEKTIK